MIFAEPIRKTDETVGSSFFVASYGSKICHEQNMGGPYDATDAATKPTEHRKPVDWERQR
jgi:hypothetical protein